LRLGAGLVALEPAWLESLAALLASRKEAYAQAAAALVVQQVLDAYAAVRGPGWRPGYDPPRIDLGHLLAAQRARCLDALAPDRLRSDWVDHIAALAMGGVLQPHLEEVDAPAGRRAGAERGGQSSRMRAALEAAMDDPDSGLQARVAELFLEIPALLAERRLRELRPAERTAAELEAFLAGG
jgi:hypothetical protein